MNELIAWDERTFKYLNQFHSPFFDGMMALVTHKLTWIPLYVYILYFIYKKARFGKNLAFLVVLVGLADRLTSGWMKPYFARLRPCHRSEWADWIQVVGNCGGQFGFASSHAANVFALAVGFALLFPKEKRKIAFLFVWASLVSYSRVYVGVHFPLDILVGGGVGALLAYLMYLVDRKLFINY